MKAAAWVVGAAVAVGAGACTGSSQVQDGDAGIGPCPGGLVECQGSCVHLGVDPLHCGGCGNACQQGQLCSAGKCVPRCGKGLTECGSSCVDSDVDPAHCGGCDQACATGQVCSAGQCGLVCLGGTTKCGDECVDTQLDPANCGSCGNACKPGKICSAGNCGFECTGGLVKCGGACVDTAFDPAHCGGCDQACAQGQVCSAGNCGVVCLGGTTKCGDKCVDTELDPGNCGSCGKACAQGEVCSAGTCSLECAGGTTKCGSSCVSTQHDPAHCGGCDKACAGGEVCSAGKCVLACGQGLTKCGGKCVDLGSDAANCGGCGKACAGACAGSVCHSGNHLWSKRFGDGSEQRAKTVAADSAGNVIVAGHFQGTADFGGGTLQSAGGDDIFVAKLAPDGSHLWSKRFGDGNWQMAESVAADSAGSVIVTGGFCGTVDFGGGPFTCVGSYDVFLAKLDKDGKHLWSKRFDDASPNQEGRSVAADSAGNVIVTGPFQGTADFGGGTLASAGSWDIFLAKLDKDGKHTWSKRFGDASDQRASSVAADSSGNVIVAGLFQGTVDFGGGPLTSAGSWDIFLAKLDKDGKHTWSKRFGDAGTQYGSSVAADNSSNVIVTGAFGGTVDFGGGTLTSAGHYDIFLAKLDKDGKHLWSKRFGDASLQQGDGVTTGTDGAVLVTGFFSGSADFGGGPLTSAGLADIFLAKFGP